MTLLSTQNLSFSYHKKHILENLSLTLPAGKLIGIVGPNGCGKSTLLKLLAKQLEPTQGEVLFKGKPLADYAARELAKQVAFLSQQPVTPAGITVEQLVQYGRHPHQSWFNQWNQDDASQVSSAIELMQLHDILQQPIASLSGGQRQRAWLAMIVAQNTDLILLDEPTSALDIGHQTEVLECISQMTAAGKTVVIVIHDLAAAARYCDEIIAISDKQIIAMGSAKEVITKPVIDTLYNTDVDIIQAPFDQAPVIVPRRHQTRKKLVNE